MAHRSRRSGRGSSARADRWTLCALLVVLAWIACALLLALSACDVQAEPRFEASSARGVPEREGSASVE